MSSPSTVSSQRSRWLRGEAEPGSGAPSRLVLGGARAACPREHLRLLILNAFLFKPTSHVVQHKSDPVALAAQTEHILRAHQASEAGLVAALRHVMLSAHIGHLAIWEGSSYTCRSFPGAGDGGLSRLGACAVPLANDFVVTFVTPGNPLGLGVGDKIVAVAGKTGLDMYEYSLQLPVCGNGAASQQGRREEAARSLFSALPAGTELRIETPVGTSRSVTTPNTQNALLYCGDPLGRETNFVAKASLREDGVAVIQLPAFVPPGGFGDGDVWQEMQEFQDQIHVVFEHVADAQALIWDVRSNIGGASPVGFAIAAGMPGARSTSLARCTTRIPFSDPIQYWHQGPDYELSPGSEFDFSGPVAVLVDGRSISAADYFARAVKLGTDALLVGTPTAGAYGGSGLYQSISTEPNIYAGLDPYRCNDIDGAPLETHSVEPDLVVEYDPLDLSQGIDTVLEAAAEALLSQ